MDGFHPLDIMGDICSGAVESPASHEATREHVSIKDHLVTTATKQKKHELAHGHRETNVEPYDA